MRYQDWDVLLFPEGSKAPLQEFRTGCFVIPDPDSTQIQTVTPLGFPPCNTIPPQTPTVACFVPNLEPGCPFRVSLHSWQPPVPSNTVQSSAPLGSVICFEARVLLDGICVANLLFSQQPTWPQVLETTSHLDNSGNPDLLRFPPFHQELLTQNWWNAGENLGRIRVIISEGLVHSKSTPPFERLKNLVSFSFQHAPLGVLENAGIAWPNPGMWCQAPPGWYSLISPSKLKAGDPDTHEHSLQCQVITDDSPPTHNAVMMAPLGTSQVFSAPRGPSQLFSAPHTFYNPGQQLGDPSWSPSPPMSDPFVDDIRSQKQREETGYGSSEPDYSHSATPSNGHINATCNIPQIIIHGELTPATAESQFEEMIASFIHGGNENLTPVTTRVNTPARTLSLCTEFSVSPDPRTLSFPNGQPRAVPVTTRDPPPPGSREPSDASMTWGQSETLEPIEKPVVKVKRNPALIIRSKKEGLGSARKSTAPTLADGDEKEDWRWSQETSNVVSEAKRKRSGTYSTSTLLRENSSSSPHKVSRISSKGDLHGPGVTEIMIKGVDRAPLGELSNSIH